MASISGCRMNMMRSQVDIQQTDVADSIYFDPFHVLVFLSVSCLQ